MSVVAVKFCPYLISVFHEIANLGTMIMSDLQRKTRVISWILFFLTIFIMLLLCLKAGSHTQGHSVLVFSLIWCACVSLLIFYPRGLSVSAARILLLSCAFLIRVMLLPHEPWDGVSSYFREIYMNLPVMLSDLGTLGFLLMLLQHRRLDSRWAVLYAFNPVILYGFAGQGGSDAAGIFFLMGALYLYDQKRWGWMFFFGGMLGGFALKSGCLAAVTLLFLIRRDNWKYAGVILLSVLISLYIGGDIRGENTKQPV